MTTKNKNYPFEFSPKLIKFLGEELIHDKKIAISELIKNAYDADADKVSLTIGDDEIIIEDNGCGMNADVIRKGWLIVGDSNKSKSNERTPKYQRLPIGEKGVGRLGVHKLGKKIQVISKMCQDDEVSFEVDWNQFENSTNLKELEPIKVVVRETPELFTDEKTGTKLIVRDLKEPITRKDIKSLNTDLIKLLPPFKHTIQDDFDIKFITKDGLFADEELLETSRIIEHALFHYKVVLKNNKIITFDYRFISPNKKKMPSHAFALKDSEFQELIQNLREEKYPEINHQSKIGKIIFEGYIFDARFSRLFHKPYSGEITNYLKDNGGIRVYRDGMRIYNYGEGGKDNDILDLDRKRAQHLGDNIGYNQLLASIELDREGSKALKEKTNREGFIHNEAFVSLQYQLNLCMEVIMQCRKRDRANMEPLFGKEYDKADINTRIKKIVTRVNQLPVSDNEKLTLQNDLQEFSEEFKQLKNIFLTASNTGLNMTFIVHEIDKIIDHLEEKIKVKDLTQIERVFIHLKNSIDAYKDVIRLDKKTASLSVDAIIKQALFSAEYRLQTHHIEYLKQIEPNLNIIGKQGLILGIFTNLFDNAIYWLDYYKIKNKQILIRTYAEDDDVAIIIADNGKGFNIAFDAALRPFISGRIDESSMGIGLHLAEQVMIAHEGSISHGDWQEENLPEEFTNGAIIKLKFKKGEAQCSTIF